MTCGVHFMIKTFQKNNPCYHWSANNIASAVTFGLALATPTGSITVFAMKVIFMINGLIGWYTFSKIGKTALKE